MQYTHIHRWPSAWLQHLQCISNGDTADPHQATDTWTLIYQIYVCIPSMYIHTNIYIKVQNADHIHDIKVVYIEEAKLSDIGGHICLSDISCDLATGCVYTGSAGIVSIFNEFMWFGDYWNMVLEIFDKHFAIDSPCIRNQAIVLVWACLSRQRSPVFGQILIDVYFGIRILVHGLYGLYGPLCPQKGC